MAPLLKTALLFLGAAAPITAEHLKVVFSSGTYAAIGGPKGNGGGSGTTSGFSIMRDNGEAIYNTDYPGDKVPCFSTDDGRTFDIEGSCWANKRTFQCWGSALGFPEKCEVRDQNGKVLGTGEGKKDTEFIGIALGQDGGCVVEFDSDDKGTCPEDDGNGPLHVA